MTGRRGLGICAMGALDMGAWDIRAKRSACRVGSCSAARASRTSRVRVAPAHRPHRRRESGIRLRAKAREAARLGFRAGKMEVCVKARTPTTGSTSPTAPLSKSSPRAARRWAGFRDDGRRLYCWTERQTSFRVLEQLEQYDLFFMETPLQLDDLDGYAFLHDHSPIRIAAGELQNGRFEFLDLMDRGKVDVAQPDVGRVGGLTEARRVCDLAADRGRLIVPPLLGEPAIGIAATAHLSAVTRTLSVHPKSPPCLLSPKPTLRPRCW
jgi:L-alanine-DL-glutamate epimerase-like enolase superfamily enzyme